MYVTNSKRNRWWEDVTLIIWGPSARLLASEEELQAGIIGMMESGVKVEACLKCTDELKVTEELRSLGIDVRYMGETLTAYIREGRKILTF